MTWRIALRITEALVFSILAGLFVWILALLFTAGIRLPLVSPVLLGFLAGGAAVQRTLQVTIADRGRRRALAAACALAGLATMHGLDYARFVHLQRRWQRALDYEASPAQVDERIATALRERAGLTGPAGYLLAALRDGAPFAPFQPHGVVLALYWAIEVAVALVIAMRWAAGPAPRTARTAS